MLPDTINRLLVARLDNTGDVVLLGPALAALRGRYPEARISLLTSKAGAQAAELLPEIDNVLVHRASWQQLLPGAVDPATELALLDALRERHYDAAIIFTSFAQSPVAPAYLCYLAGIPVRAAFASHGFTGEAITHPVSGDDAPPHQADRNLYLVESLGIEALQRDLAVSLSDSVWDASARRLRTAGIESSEPFAILAPGASASARRYEPERFAEAARLIAATHDLPVAVLGSERERPLAEGIARQAGDARVRSLAGDTTVAEAAATIAQSSLVIANNSLALHLADALRVPVVATYAGTDPPSYWRPRATRHRILTSDVGCAPCYRIDCDRGHECLDLPPERVARAASALLSEMAPLAAV